MNKQAQQHRRKHKNSRGFAELFGVAGSVLVSSVSEPGLDLSLWESTLLPQAYDLTLNTNTHLYLYREYGGTHADADLTLHLRGNGRDDLYWLFYRDLRFSISHMLYHVLLADDPDSGRTPQIINVCISTIFFSIAIHLIFPIPSFCVLG